MLGKPGFFQAHADLEPAKSNMDHLTLALLEAHVQHELSRFSSKNSRMMIREETAAVFQALRTSKLNDILKPEQIIEIIARNVVAFPITQAITALAADIGERVLKHDQNQSTALRDIIPRGISDATIKKISTLKRARQELVHRLVSSSVYSQQISEALFSGIKEYLLTENILAQKVPGLASLIKFGKFAVNKTLHPLELAVEKTVKAYIEANLGNTLKRSETSINDHFESPEIIELSAQIWATIAKDKVSEYFELLDTDDLGEFIAIGMDFWLHFRSTAYFRNIYTDIVMQFFDKHGDRELSNIASDFGLTEKRISAELQHLLPPVFATLLANGFLEERIRARLQHFYQAPRTAKLLASLLETERLARPSVAAPTQKTPTARRKSAG